MRSALAKVFVAYFIFSFPFLTNNIVAAQQSTLLPYKNAHLSIGIRVKDLLKRMTLEEKIAQTQCVWSQEKRKFTNAQGEFSESMALQHFANGLGQVARPNETFGMEYLSKSLNAKQTALLSNQIQHFFVNKTRLGIPVMFHEEGLHGNQAKDATHFPSHLALGATWNENLLTQIYTAVAKEIRVRGAQQVLAPVVDLGRDPRWGRTEETLGEDPYHVARLALAELRGYQGNSNSGTIDSNHVIATLKHFGVHGIPENGSNIGPVFVDERTLREVYFPPFELCIKEGRARSVMPCYNELSGVPAHANRWLLTQVLRKEWGFKGIITSDYGGIQDLRDVHFVAEDSLQAALMALNAGVDIETPNNFAYGTIATLIRNKRLSQAVLDSTVARILTVKFELGLFDQPYTNPEAAEQIVGSTKHRELALQAATESIVLLKNNHQILPIDIQKYKQIAIIGPNANRCILGGYSGEPKVCISPLEGIKTLNKPITISYSEGCRLTDSGSWFKDPVVLSNRQQNLQRIAEAVSVAKAADMVILFVGGNEVLSREAWSVRHHGDIPNLELVGEQNELISAIKATGKPIVAVVNSGQPLAFQHLNNQVDAVVQAWYLGQEGGTAIAQMLFGESNPSGKLPISIARSAGHLPVYYNHKPSSKLRGYLLEEATPLYPFGFGLSYTQFAYSNLQISRSSIGSKDSAVVSVTVANIGKQAGSEVVQCYIRDDVSTITRPVKELKDFTKVYLQPGEKKVVRFTITPDKLSFYDANMRKVVEKGSFTIMVGTSSISYETIKLQVQ